LFFVGIGIQVFGKVNQATYTISLDGVMQPTSIDSANNILADLRYLTDNIHTIILKTQISASQSQLQPEFFFDKVLITASPIAK
jgi:hypothetical protein